MKKTGLFLLLLLCVLCTHAQLKLTTTGGISNTIGNKPDSLFFAKKTGSNLQLNAAYYWGRLALGLKLGTAKYKPTANLTNITPPNLPNRLSATANGIRNTYFLLGPEICLCYRQIKIMPNIKLGIMHTVADSTIIKLESINGTPRKYSTGLANANSFAYNVGVNIAVKISNTIGIATNLDYMAYKLKATLTDTRSSTNPTRPINQPRQYFNAGLGIYVTF